MLSSSNKSKFLSFIVFISWFNKSISRASLNEDISNSFSGFSFQCKSTHKMFVCIVGLKILYLCLFFTYASVVKKEHTLKVKRLPHKSRSRFIPGSIVGAVVRALTSHQCGPGSIPASDVICGLSLLVLYSAPRGFYRGTLVLPSHQKPTFDLIWFVLVWFLSPQLVEPLCSAK